MEDSIKNKLNDILSGLGGGRGQSTSSISDLLNSKKGKEIAASLTEEEKKNIIKRFLSMDTKEINEKLKKADPSVLKNLSTDDIRKKLR